MLNIQRGLLKSSRENTAYNFLTAKRKEKMQNKENSIKSTKGMKGEIIKIENKWTTENMNVKYKNGQNKFKHTSN